MDHKRVITAKLTAGCYLFLLPAATCMALITGEHGNRPIEDRGWPSGSVDVANLPSRLGYWEGPPFGGGEYHFEYRCENTEQFNDALTGFAAIKAEKLELVVHNGPEYSFWLRRDGAVPDGENNRVDWAFTVWIPQSWNSLFNSPSSYRIHSDHPNFRKSVAAPKIDLYIGGGKVLWQQVKVPRNVTVIDKRPGSISSAFAETGLVHGNVFDMDTGKPIGEAEIVLVIYENGKWKEVIVGKTDQQGFCKIEKVPLGSYEIRIRAQGYVPRKQGSYSNKRSEYLSFKTGLTRPASVSGRVVDQNGAGIQGLTVTAAEVIGPDGFGYAGFDQISAVTDAQGRFALSSLPKGFTCIRCSGKSLHLQNSIFEQYQIPSDDVKLTMIGTSVVRGRVVDRDGRRPSGQIVLDLRPPGEDLAGKWTYSGYLAEDGKFELAGVPPGRYVITTRPNPSRGEYRPNAQYVTVESGREYDLTITFAESSQ